MSWQKLALTANKYSDCRCTFESFVAWRPKRKIHEKICWLRGQKQSSPQQNHAGARPLLLTRPPKLPPFAPNQQ